MHFTSFSIFDIHLNLFETEPAMWRNVTGGYLFGRIGPVNHRIKTRSKGPN
jgi:hypothetical protein